jgi:hypothetical protein
LTFSDQPFVTAPFLKRLADRDGLGGKEIVASQYNGIAGAPVFFSRTMYAELLAVAPNKGTRELILQFPEKLHSIPCAEAGLEADAPNDYGSLLARDTETSDRGEIVAPAKLDAPSPGNAQNNGQGRGQPQPRIRLGWGQR